MQLDSWHKHDMKDFLDLDEELPRQLLEKFLVSPLLSEKKTHCRISSKRVWRYQRGNQNPYIEEEQTTQWPKEKGQKDKQRSTKHTHKIKDRVTRTSLKTGGELRCSGRTRHNVDYAFVTIITSEVVRRNKANVINTSLQDKTQESKSKIINTQLQETTNQRIIYLPTRKNK